MNTAKNGSLSRGAYLRIGVVAILLALPLFMLVFSFDGLAAPIDKQVSQADSLSVNTAEGKALTEEHSNAGDANRLDVANAGYGYIPDLRPAKSIHDANEDDDNQVLGVQSVDAIPGAYSSKDAGYTTLPGDQGPFGLCWVFAPTAAAESSAMKEGLSSHPSFSERQLAYFAYHEAPDPLGNTAGDSSKPLKVNYGEYRDVSDPYLGVGGNSRMAAKALASWRGFADEFENDALNFDHLIIDHYDMQVNSEPYESFLERTALDPSLAYKDVFHLENCYEIAMRDSNEVKQAVMNYGGASVALNYGSEFLDEGHEALYNPETDETNHEVEIVGWDNAYSADCFGENASERWTTRATIPDIANSISVGESVALTASNNKRNWVSFTPKEDGVYTFTSLESGGNVSSADLYRADENGVVYSCGGFTSRKGSPLNLETNLRSGRTYYLGCYASEDGSTYSIVVERTGDLPQGFDEGKPSKDGAWLVKNSYSSDSNADGYFWVSYEDKSLQSDEAKAFVFDVAAANNFNHIYQYDGTIASKSRKLESGGRIANVFEAKGNPTGAEAVSAVSFALESTNVDYSIQVYRNVKDGANPTLGKAVLAKPVTGKTSYSGYYTVKLPEPVVVAEGSKYAVVVTLSHADDTPVLYDVDTTFNEEGIVQFTNTAAAGQSYEKAPSSSWIDLALIDDDDEYVDCCARLKAFTKDVDASKVPVDDGMSGVWGTCAWDIDDKGLLTVHAGTGEDGNGRSPWADSADAIKDVVFDEGVILPRNCEYLFSNCYEESNGILNSVKSIDMAGADFSQVKYMGNMFYGCAALTSVEFGNPDTSCVESMGGMFCRCKAIESLDLSGFETGKLRNVVDMLNKCSSLRYIDLSSFNLSLRDTEDGGECMFSECTSLNSLKLGPQFRFGTWCALPNPTPDGDSYAWRGPDAVYASSEEFISQYDGSSPGVYTWSEAPVVIPKTMADADIAVEPVVYSGKALKPKATVVLEGLTLNQGSDYTVAYENNVNAGIGRMTVTGAGEYADLGAAVVTFDIAKAANPMKVKAKTVKVSAKKVKRKTQTIKAKKAYTVKKAKGKVTYKLESVSKAKFKKYFKVNEKTGKITVKKKLKKGTYKLKVRVMAAGNANYQESVRTVTVKVRVK